MCLRADWAWKKWGAGTQGRLKAISNAAQNVRLIFRPALNVACSVRFNDDAVFLIRSLLIV